MGDDAAPDAPPPAQPQFVLPWLQPGNMISFPGGVPSGDQGAAPSPGPVTSPDQGAPSAPAPGPTMQAPTGHWIPTPGWMQPAAHAPITSPGQVTAPPMTPEQRKQAGLTAMQGATDEATASIGREGQALQARGELEQQGANEQGAILGQKSAAVTANAEQAKQDFAKQAAAVDAKSKEADAASQAYQDYHVDRNRIWHQASTGQKALSLIGVALSGIGMAMARRPGENPALQMMEQMAKDDTDVQMAEQSKLGNVVQQKRGAVADLQGRFANENAQRNVLMAAKLESLNTDLQRAAVVNGGAVQKQNAAMVGEQLTQKATALKQQAAQTEVGQAQQDINTTREESHFQQTQGLQYAHLAEQRREFNMTNEINQEKERLAEKAEQDKANKGKAAELQENGIMMPTGIDKQTGQATYDYLKQQDGQTAFVPPKKAGEELRPKYEGTIKALDAIDNLRRMRDETGGNYTKLSAEAKQKMAEYERALIGTHQAAGISGFRGNVMEVMDKQLSGGADPTAIMVNVDKLLEQARGNLAKDFNGALRAANYTGKDVEFPDPMKLEKPSESREKTLQRPLTTVVPSGEFRAPGLMGYGGMPEQSEAAKGAGMFDSQKQSLDTLGAMLQVPEQRDTAIKILGETAKTAPTDEMRTYATHLLEKFTTSPQPGASPMVAGAR